MAWIKRGKYIEVTDISHKEKTGMIVIPEGKKGVEECSSIKK